ncbi:MAG: tRNA pseudouridine(38-40) synthase TruA [Clostridia bacterium]|nr:tRNA pseudouridine(38-40) synthase TruA [Clostridia bacterium]
MKLLLKLIWNGAGYAGYQAQRDIDAPKPSIQRTLTAAFSEGLGFPCRVTGCSRTDAGVHALGFCAAVEPAGAHEDDWLRIPVGRVHRAMRSHLPPDIAIAGEAAVPDDFHPRYSAVGKEYLYRMNDAPWDDPFAAGTAWHLPRPLPPDGIERMRRAASFFVGRRDFTSFMAAGSKITDATRCVTALTVERTGHEIALTVSADGFLYHMVRILAGTLADCAWGSIEPEDFAAILAARDRSRAGRTAPAHGLYLARVEYHPPIDWQCE